MSINDDDYDWAAAALAVELCDSVNLKELVEAASLDPLNGELSDVDLSDLDLRGQSMVGWDLSYATFRGARIAGADLRRAKLNAETIIDAVDWMEAKLEINVRLMAAFAAVKRFDVDKLEVSVGTLNALLMAEIDKIGSLMKFADVDLMEAMNVPQKSVDELEEVLKNFSLSLVHVEDKEEEQETDYYDADRRNWVFVIDKDEEDQTIRLLKLIDYYNKPNRLYKFDSGSLEFKSKIRTPRKRAFKS